MKILYEKDNITFEEATTIFEKFITTDYNQIDSLESDEEFESSLYSNGCELIRIDSKYYEANDLNYLRLTYIPLKIKNIADSFNFSSVQVVKMTPKDLNFKITSNQLKTIVNALFVHKDFLSNMNTCDTVDKLRVDYAINDVKNCIDYLQSIMDYDYDKSCELCKVKSKSKNSMLGLGKSGFEQSARNI